MALSAATAIPPSMEKLFLIGWVARKRRKKEEGRRESDMKEISI